MAQAKNKTAPDGGSVDAFIDGVEDAGRREDCRRLLKLMRQVTGEKAEMWGASIVGFGRYRYRYESGREGDWFLTGFSPLFPHRMPFDVDAKKSAFTPLHPVSSNPGVMRAQGSGDLHW